MAESLEIKSPISVRDYVGFLQESYLIFELFKYDYSLKKQFVSDKKAYVIDNGMRNVVSFSFSEDKGRLLENLIYIELRRRGYNVFFDKGKNECDFLIEEKGKIVNAIQVCYSLNDSNQEREVAGLVESLKKNNLKKGTIINYSDEKVINYDGFTIDIVPAINFLTTKN